ncbi:2-iminoacetate synthase ThiH [Roseimicrobium sp. ORNL1]|uniref:2-iminoacetate synthase ThiH n=1 Tax=Roseimicrobium sp. ORNL1 TaxID=2711231 RepID=UPI0013E1D839|nr:2-iminoacetate synthase ThiH [Roseimicrobium sp. ORNL1]QIF00469.1 2-iminoacetate synthase ThiH [Roseimicrobium sp. ORNL1]
MSFVDTFNVLPEQKSPLLRKLLALLEPKTPKQLEAMAAEAAALTRSYFGKTMRLFAPLYLSNECVNNCAYCGFSRDNPIFRVTLNVDQVIKEAKHLEAQGFRHILLVAGEHPKFVSNGYLEECIRAIKPFIPTVGIEVGPMEQPEYERMVHAGSEGLVVYQETYDRAAYNEYHTAGPKKDFDWRLECPERGYHGGFRRIGLGALLGLADWRTEALGLAAHLEYMQNHGWKASYTIAFPRLRPAAGSFEPKYPVDDAKFIQLLCAFRLCFPQVGIVLSTRESPALRDALLPICITTMSAGSHTEPGGYTGEGRDDLHLTVKGRRVELQQKSSCDEATGQFDISDHRSPQEISDLITRRGFDPVWKDWDEAILQA